MKKYLKLSFLTIILVTFLTITTGCSNDSMDNINIIVTNYSNEYITKLLYSNHSTITSIYPDGVKIEDYTINKKQKQDYSKADLFIYNGLIEKERNLAVDLLEINPSLKIIDSSYVLETDYSPEELWLNPSSLLMMANNIRMGLNEYVTSTYLQKDIDAAYEEAKISLSELDATYRLAIQNTDHKKIVVDNSALKFLEKFDLEVYCIDGDATDKVLDEVKDLIEDKEINYIYTFKNDELSDNAKSIIDIYPEVKANELHKLDNISDTERAEKLDYATIMNNNLELLKQELYQ